METLDDKIKKFLDIGYGYGDGDGSGDGSGYGSGDGYGSGSGYGDGSGYGYGYGYGYGDGFKVFNGHKVYRIDGVATVIYSVHGNIARGATIRGDMNLEPCYIAKEGNCFAHGETAHQATMDAYGKYVQNMPEEDRIRAFVDAHPSLKERYPASDLFEWHNTLTGSCRMGRENFCKERGINIEEDSFTIEEFVELTKDSYGGDTIEHLLLEYN